MRRWTPILRAVHAKNNRQRSEAADANRRVGPEERVYSLVVGANRI